MMYILYAILAGLGVLIGGLLPRFPSLRKIQMRYSIGFAAGTLITTAFLGMIPELRPGSFDALALAFGFFFFYLVEKILMIHACGERECKTHDTAWGVIGISIDNIVDGAAIAAGYLINPALGLTITIAVIMHEIPQGFSTTILMKKAGYKFDKILMVLVIAAILTPIGAVLSSYISDEFFRHILAFAAGSFIYVGASDLLPEAHKVFNMRVILSVLLGVLSILVLGILV